MPIIRTPEERFEGLPDYPFEPHYVEIKGCRVHYVDEGTGEAVLCLHGEPSWSFLYRKMIPILAKKHRVVAPDFIGFGKSDKFTEMSEYSFQMHRDTLAGFIEKLELDDITLVCQDWGGLIGLRVASEMPERFARLVIMNTGLPTGEGEISEGFMQWRTYVENTPDLPIGQIMQMAMADPDRFTPEIARAYEAPFPDHRYKAGAQMWPLLVPIRPDDPGADSMRKAREVFGQWTKPCLVMFSDGDPITRGGDKLLRAHIPSASKEPEITIRDAGHFLQEEKGEEIARHILDFMERRPLRGQ
ncbi:MAG: haloalkane dehalogenase [Candidatus Abyssubacteria bacterium]